MVGFVTNTTQMGKFARVPIRALSSVKLNTRLLGLEFVNLPCGPTYVKRLFVPSKFLNIQGSIYFIPLSIGVLRNKVAELFVEHVNFVPAVP